MNPYLQGAVARDTGTEFEKQIARSIAAYARAGVAYLDFVPVPMTPCGMRHPHTKAPLYIPKGKAPFDIYGYAPRGEQQRQAVFVGAELKASNKAETSLAIVKPDGHGSGVAYHQLAALAQVAREGGITRIVWDNGGQIGVLGNEAIIAALAVYETSLQTDLRGKGKGPSGARSIRWESFQPVGFGNVSGVVCVDWLKPDGK